VFLCGSSPDIHIFQEEGNTIILFGRIYKPIHVNSLDRLDSKRFQRLFWANLDEISGSFVVFKIVDFSPNFEFSLSTDKFGFRRLFYRCCGDILYFSTHILGFKHFLDNKQWSESYEALVHYYNFGFTPRDQTIYNDIKKVPPGNTIVVQDEKVSMKKYFFLEKHYNPALYARQEEKVIAKRLDDLFEKCVLEKINPKSTGLALSGGVDSGYIAIKMIQNKINFVGYNLAFKDNYNEFNRIDYMAKAFNIKIKKIILEPAQIIKNFESSNAVSSEPLSFNNSLSRFICLNAKEDNVVDIWDGDGADRLFLGMSRYLKIARAIRLFDLAKRAKIANFLKYPLGFLPGREFRKLYILFRNWNNGLAPYPERKMDGLDKYSQDYEEMVFKISMERFIKELRDVSLQKNVWFLYTYFSIQMCPEMFFYDASEIHAEFDTWPVHAYWDDDVVSLAISLPLKMKIRGNITKYILRKAASRNLDKKYLLLPKIGLQDAYKYISWSKEGSSWRNEQIEKVLHSEEYNMLTEIIPAKKIDPDKLISLVVWKEKQNILQ